MSEPHAKTEADFVPKHVKSHVGSALVRQVHDSGVAVGVVPLLLLVGCVIPPSLSVDNQDAGVNSPPAITAVRADIDSYAEPGPVKITPGEGTLNLQLLDSDATDTLHVRMFVNYTVDNPTGPRALCTAAPVEKVQRSVTCDVGAVCLPGDVTAEDRSLLLQVVVFDRMPLEAGEPRFQAMPEGGLSTSKTFYLTCDATGGL